MSTAIGKRMIDGGAVKYHSVAGNGIARKVASTVIRHIGHMAVDKAANMVQGSGYKIAGEGRHRKVGRPTTKNAAAYKRYHTKKKKK